MAKTAVRSEQIKDEEVKPSDLQNTAVTPGTYTRATITVDEDGRITLASSNGAGSGPTEANVIALIMALG